VHVLYYQYVEVPNEIKQSMQVFVIYSCI